MTAGAIYRRSISCGGAEMLRWRAGTARGDGRRLDLVGANDVRLRMP
jgi:hypothetical protein